MSSKSFRISLTYDQVLDIVRQMPTRDKIRLSRELARETTNKQLSALLEAFQTDEISEEEINYEVEQVRAQIYAKKKKDQGNN